MDDMQVPEQVYLMAPAVHPVAVEINDDKSENVNDQFVLNSGDGQVFEHKRIDADGDGKAENIFGNVGNAAAEGGDHVHIADGIKSFAPAIPFFKKYQNEKGGHGNQ